MLYAVSGLFGAGKDTVADFMVGKYGFTKIAFANPIRESLLILNPYVPSLDNGVHRLNVIINSIGWDRAKREIPEIRRLMQQFGTEVGRSLLGENVWVDVLYKHFPGIDDPEQRYVITDCRFANEAEFIHNHGGDLLWIDRPGIVSDGHASESLLMRDKADYILRNDETIEELQEDLRLLLFMRGVDPIG
jgi:hypothetical protein